MLSLLVLPVAARADGSAADAAWAAYQAALSAPSDKPYNQLTPLERHQWIEQRMLKARELGLAFIEQHPADPRRWKVVATFTARSPRFVKDWGAVNDKGVPTAPVVDLAAAGAWEKQVTALQTAMRKADDLPDDLRMQLAAQDVANAINAAGLAHQRGGATDLPTLRAQLQAFASKYPASPAGTSILFSYASLVEKTQPAQFESEWRFFADSPNAGMAEMAKGKLTFFALAKEPLDLAFTAADGRAVDLAQLRGKVVLIDFWATWCGPCIAELPNVKKVYADYHDKGFEIVGITLENAKLTSRDSKEQTEEKLEQARKVLLEFVAKNELPWPQSFDGKWWKSELAGRFAVNAIPAMLLLDKSGRVVSLNARGPKLEQEVKRLLQL